MSSKLLYVSVPIIDWQKCYDFYHNTGININNKSICAGALDKDSCQVQLFFFLIINYLF